MDREFKKKGSSPPWRGEINEFYFGEKWGGLLINDKQYKGALRYLRLNLQGTMPKEQDAGK